MLSVCMDWARTDNLAQASQARLTETGKGLPKPFARDVAQVGGSRLGEGNSPERESLSLERELGERMLRNSLGSLGEILRVVLQWSGRNSMAPLEGEQRYPPQVQAPAESDQVICIRMSRVES
ncbi:hypothetical protein DEO72_LG4g802 [Vigna unguiculata]|uniref:Uncharacterized protein n=1 Tax=Vigna unguiculata TaxID=3917 RepID=A0A4D6LM31_VIGUN|nr:hypothetical protein DEO72_LG4g802 [Vigna unguiculata]